MRPGSSTSTSGVVRDPILMGGEPVPQCANPIASREVSLPNDGIRFESDTSFRSDETDARFEATAYRAYCHRRRHWRGLVFRFRQGRPERGSGPHTGIRRRRIGDFLYYAGLGRIAPVWPG